MEELHSPSHLCAQQLQAALGALPPLQPALEPHWGLCGDCWSREPIPGAPLPTPKWDERVPSSGFFQFLHDFYFVITVCIYTA